MSLWTLLANAARTWPDRPAVSVGDRLHLTYADLARRAAGLSSGLRARGLHPGARVVLAMANHPDYLTVLFACWHAGVIAVPLNARLHPREMAGIAEDTGAALCLATEDVAPSLAPTLACPLVCVGDTAYRELARAEPGAAHQVRPEDIAWIFATSGTTGRPKGAMLTHRNLMAMAVSYLADVETVTEQSALLHLAAQSHASGLFGLSFAARGAHHVLPASGGYDPGEMADLIARLPGLTVFAAPTLLRRMVADPPLRSAPVERMGTVLTGAMPVQAGDLKDALGLFGPRLWNGYGQGESPCTITHMSRSMIARAAAEDDDARLTSVGVARTGMAVALTDATGQPVPDGEIGEIRVTGETVMAGYWGQAAATAETLVDGWLRTGDLGRFDARGFLSLVGRTKEMIISGGLNVYPREVEDVLAAQPGVAEVAVVGLPHAEWGEMVAAAIVPVDPAAPPQPDRLDRACLERLARFKRPRVYWMVPDLPRNATGKVMKETLKAEIGDEARPS